MQVTMALEWIADNHWDLEWFVTDILAASQFTIYPCETLLNCHYLLSKSLKLLVATAQPIKKDMSITRLSIFEFIFVC